MLHGAGAQASELAIAVINISDAILLKSCMAQCCGLSMSREGDYCRLVGGAETGDNSDSLWFWQS